MSFDTDDKFFDFNVKAWLQKKGSYGRLAGAAFGIALSLYFSYHPIGAVLVVWGFSALGKQLATLDEFRDHHKAQEDD